VLTSDPCSWRLILDDDCPGTRNMAVDESIMLAMSRKEVPPTFRLYGWNPPAVSVGYFQDLEREIDLERCGNLGIDWVRRPTGGRAVLHENEVTYSVVVAEDILRGSVLETYLKLSRGLVAALRALGADALVASGDVRRSGGSAACFDAPSSYEIVCDGKKVVGSAQTRQNGIILQHGSVPLAFDAVRAAGVLRFDSDKARDRVAASLGRKATGLTQVLRRRVTVVEVREALVGGISRAMGLEMRPGALTPAEEKEALRLEREKYSSPDWNGRKHGRGQRV